MSGAGARDRAWRDRDRQEQSGASLRTRYSRFWGMALVLGAATLLACGPTDRTGAPDVPLAFLQERVQVAIRDVEQARAGIGANWSRSASMLRDATVRLRQLAEYYLPVLAARARVGRASQAAASDPAAARWVIDSTEVLLRKIVRTHGRHFEAEFREPLEWIEDARTALEAGDRGEARRVLSELEEHLESIFYRGRILLKGSGLDPGSRRSLA